MKKRLALLILIVFLLPSASSAAALVDINTASEVQLETLPGIGPTKAGAIVDYRAQQGPFAAIADIQKVSGIGPSTFAEIQALITVDGDDDTFDPTQDSSASSTAATATSTVPSAPPQYAPVPQVYVDAGPDRVVTTGAETTFAAAVTDPSGKTYTDAEVKWSFGDASTAIGASVLKSYRAPGQYLVEVNAIESLGSGHDEVVVTVKDAQVSLPAVSAEGITIKNEGADPLDLSYWQLRSGETLFTIPSGTVILAGGSVLLPADITHLAFSTDAALLYPNGSVAAAYQTQNTQLVSTAVGSTPVQGIKNPAVGTDTSVSPPAHAAQPVDAPATTTEIAAAGAPMLSWHFLTSPWVLGAGGLLVISAAALIVL